MGTLAETFSGQWVGRLNMNSETPQILSFIIRLISTFAFPFVFSTMWREANTKDELTIPRKLLFFSFSSFWLCIFCVSLYQGLSVFGFVFPRIIADLILNISSFSILIITVTVVLLYSDKYKKR